MPAFMVSPFRWLIVLVSGGRKRLDGLFGGRWGRREEHRRGEGLQQLLGAADWVDIRRVDTDPALVAADRLKSDNTLDHGVDRVVLADADVAADPELGATLADDDRAGIDVRTVGALHAQPLRLGVAAVTRTTDTFFMGHGGSPSSLLAVDSGNSQARLLLAVAGAPAVALLRLVLEDDEFFAAEVVVDRGRNARPFDDRRPDLGGAVAADEEHLIEGDVVAGLGGEPFDGDRVTDADPVLLATGLDDGVLDRTARRPWLPSFALAALGRSGGGGCLDHHVALASNGLGVDHQIVVVGNRLGVDGDRLLSSIRLGDNRLERFYYLVRRLINLIVLLNWIAHLLSFRNHAHRARAYPTLNLMCLP